MTGFKLRPAQSAKVVATRAPRHQAKPWIVRALLPVDVELDTKLPPDRYGLTGRGAVVDNRHWNWAGDHYLAGSNVLCGLDCSTTLEMASRSEAGLVQNQ